jgi:hypothetical protein
MLCYFLSTFYFFILKQENLPDSETYIGQMEMLFPHNFIILVSWDDKSENVNYC